MRTYILKRALEGLISVWVLVTVIFVLSRATGDPTDLMMALQSNDADRAILRAELGLDRPLYEQYLTFCQRLVRLDFGVSLRAKRPVSDIIVERMPVSLNLVTFSMLGGLLLAVPMGVLAAAKRGGVLDALVRLLAIMGQSIPPFLVGILFIQVFVSHLRLFPSGGVGGPSSWVLPSFTLAWFVVAGIMRLLRSSMIEALDSEFVAFARAKGVSPQIVIWKHALRNSVLPILTFSGMYFGILIGGAIIVEVVFSLPGIGRLAYEAVLYRDFPLVQGVAVTLGTAVVAINLLVDVLYSLVDPRIRYQASS